MGSNSPPLEALAGLSDSLVTNKTEWRWWYAISAKARSKCAFQLQFWSLGLLDSFFWDTASLFWETQETTRRFSGQQHQLTPASQQSWPKDQTWEWKSAGKWILLFQQFNQIFVEQNLCICQMQDILALLWVFYKFKFISKEF